MFQKFLIQPGHIGTGRTVDKHGIEDVHSYHFVTQAVQIARRTMRQLFTAVLQTDTFAVEHRIVPAGNTHDLKLQPPFFLQFLTLLRQLRNQATTHRPYSAQKKIEDLVFRKKKTIMDDIKCLA